MDWRDEREVEGGLGEVWEGKSALGDIRDDEKNDS